MTSEYLLLGAFVGRIVLVSCQHEDQWYDSQHERTDISAEGTAAFVGHIIKEHRANLLEKSVICEHRPDPTFRREVGHD